MVNANSPVGESRSDAPVEGTMPRVQGQMRTINVSIARAVGEELDVKPIVWHWVVERAADIFNRHGIGEDGVTFHKRVKGREATIPMAANGEYHLTKQFAEDRASVESPWVGGMPLGWLRMSNGYVNATPCGDMRAHFIERMIEDER